MLPPEITRNKQTDDVVRYSSRTVSRGENWTPEIYFTTSTTSLYSAYANGEKACLYVWMYVK